MMRAEPPPGRPRFASLAPEPRRPALDDVILTFLVVGIVLLADLRRDEDGENLAARTKADGTLPKWRAAWCRPAS